MIEAKIRDIGNSLGIILPKDIFDLLGLKKGDFIGIQLKGKQLNLVLGKKT